VAATLSGLAISIPVVNQSHAPYSMNDGGSFSASQGHFLMSDLNNGEIADLLSRYLAENKLD